MRRKYSRKIPLGSENFLSVLEGLEGGFAIFTGIIVGLSFEQFDRRLLIITALIGIIVNAFNSSAVRYSSEHYTDELDGREKKNILKHYFTPAAVEFLVYVLVGTIVLLPLVFIYPLWLAVLACVLLTISVLFLAGYYKGTLLKTRPWRDGFELSMLGLLIIGIGAIAGYGLSRFIAL